MIGSNVDFRYPEGFPMTEDARRFGISPMRCISLPAMEYWAGVNLREGRQVIAVYTGESHDPSEQNPSGRYVMRNCSAIQIGNEPLMEHKASWPSGTISDVIDMWKLVQDLVWSVHGEWFPLVGPGIWSQRHDLWSYLANRVEAVTAAAVHVYPGASNHSIDDIENHLARYRDVRPDLDLICTEWTARWDPNPNKGVVSVARAIDLYCSKRLWYTWNDPGQPDHKLVNTPELGLLEWLA